MPWTLACTGRLLVSSSQRQAVHASVSSAVASPSTAIAGCAWPSGGRCLPTHGKQKPRTHINHTGAAWQQDKSEIDRLSYSAGLQAAACACALAQARVCLGLCYRCCTRVLTHSVDAASAAMHAACTRLWGRGGSASSATRLWASTCAGSATVAACTSSGASTSSTTPVGSSALSLLALNLGRQAQAQLHFCLPLAASVSPYGWAAGEAACMPGPVQTDLVC